MRTILDIGELTSHKARRNTYSMKANLTFQHPALTQMA
jgi:hypothetical protein